MWKTKTVNTLKFKQNAYNITQYIKTSWLTNFKIFSISLVKFIGKVLQIFTSQYQEWKAVLDQND